MKGTDLSRQLGDLPEDMIAEAMAPARFVGRKYLAGRVLRIAACLAVVVGILAFVFQLYPKTESNFPISPLTITAFALESKDSSSDLHSVILTLEQCGFWASNISSLSHGCPITLSVNSDNFDSDDITFRVSTDQGGLMIGENGVDQIYQSSYKFFDKDEIVLNNTTIYWRTEKQTADGWTRLEGDLAYIDIVIYEKDVIIGHCVCEVRRVYMDGVGTSMFQVSVIVNESVSE